MVNWGRIGLGFILGGPVGAQAAAAADGKEIVENAVSVIKAFTSDIKCGLWMTNPLWWQAVMGLYAARENGIIKNQEDCIEYYKHLVEATGAPGEGYGAGECACKAVFSASKENAIAAASSTLKSEEIASIGSLNLTGIWECTEDRGNYYIRQVGDGIYWYGESSFAVPEWANIATGKIIGNTINLEWVDVPCGRNAGRGNLTLERKSQVNLFAINKSGNYFSGSNWLRVG